MTVTEFNSRAAALLRKQPRLKLLLLEGELCGLQCRDGTLFFSLRDAGSSVRAVMFRDAAGRLRFSPENGMAVIAAGSAGFYASKGEFQFCVTDMLLQGIGSVQKGFSRTEQKLAGEGLFDDAQKKAIPEHPRKIGLISSASGAALHDVQSTLRRRAPDAELILFPVHVQGNLAGTEICQALDTADSQNLDLLILSRGGGSAEDLEVFNAEAVVRAVHACRTPVISAVGHETDFTLTDKAADLRAATPTAAAELASAGQSAEIFSESGEIIRSVGQISPGDCLKIHLPDGVVFVRAEKKENVS